MKNIVTISLFAIGLLCCQESVNSGNIDDRKVEGNYIDSGTINCNLNQEINLRSTLTIDSIIALDESKLETFDSLKIDISPYKHWYIEQINVQKWNDRILKIDAQVQHGTSTSTAGKAKYEWYFDDNQVFQSIIIDNKTNGDVHLYEISHDSEIDFRSPPITHFINGHQVYHHMDTWQSRYKMNLDCLKVAEEYLNDN
ncbi:MAG: hypothetical protein HWE22_19820 [Flavobacteriales bacterium]|nr:hypothetical protein [Flavobacteriales bacterium]